MTKKKTNTTGIPQHEIDSLARALLPAIQALFETEEGKKEFEEWKAKKAESQLYTQPNKRLTNELSDQMIHELKR